MDNLTARLPMLVPKAIVWAEAQSRIIAEKGLPLTAANINDARAVGVAHPEKIRVLLVPCMPMPEDDDLHAFALHLGLPKMAGLTLGHGIFILDGHVTRRLLSHECRHVYQYEEAGSIAAFMAAYLKQVASFGYLDAPLEIDARTHEIQ